MELEGDNPTPRTAPTPTPTPTQNLQVTPENVVALAKMFGNCADILRPVTSQADAMMWLRGPWMDDPVSKWATDQFNKYFVEDETSFVRVLKAQVDQHAAMKDALIAAARQYGLTEELIAEGLIQAGPAA